LFRSRIKQKLIPKTQAGKRVRNGLRVSGNVHFRLPGRVELLKNLPLNTSRSLAAVFSGPETGVLQNEKAAIEEFFDGGFLRQCACRDQT